MLDYLLENFDSIDLEHPRFYSRPCTRCLSCLRCTGKNVTVKQQGDANFFYCSSHEHMDGRPLFPRAIGLGQQHQVTREISWLERYENANELGTPLSFTLVPPEPQFYAVVDHGGFRDEDWLFLKSLKPGMELEEEVADCGSYDEFTNLASALIYIVKELKRGFYQFDMKVDGNPLTYHEIMEAFAPSR